MYTDDHCGRYVGLLEQPAPLRDSLTVTSEDDSFGRIRWNVHRDLPSTIVLKCLSHKLSRDRPHGFAGRSVGLTRRFMDVIVRLFLHGPPRIVALSAAWIALVWFMLF